MINLIIYIRLWITNKIFELKYSREELQCWAPVSEIIMKQDTILNGRRHIKRFTSVFVRLIGKHPSCQQNKRLWMRYPPNVNYTINNARLSQSVKIKIHTYQIELWTILVSNYRLFCWNVINKQFKIKLT